MGGFGATLPEDWQAAVYDTLSQADSTHLKANHAVRGGMSIVKSVNAEYARQRDTVSANFSQKIGNTQDLVQKLMSSLHSVKQTTQHCDWSLKKLQTALQALAQPTAVCHKRLELRSKMPKRERVHDAFQEALLKEDRELQVSKGRYIAAIAATEQILQELGTRKQDLQEDLHDKQHGLQLDHACVGKGSVGASFSPVLDKSYNRNGFSPSMPGSARSSAARTMTPFSAEESSGMEQERSRAKRTLQSIEKASRIEASAEERCAETRALLDSSARALAAAHKATQAEMAAKVEHTEVLRQELLKQQKATINKAAQLEKYLSLAADKLQAIEKPISANNTRDKIRSARVPREAISDPVTEALHAQKCALQTKKLTLQSQTASMQDTLEELYIAVRTIGEDIEDKDKALAIDRACAGVKNPAHSTLSYGFARVGTGQRHLSDTGSSTLRQTAVGLRPSSVPASPSRLRTPRVGSGVR